MTINPTLFDVSSILGYYQAQEDKLRYASVRKVAEKSRDVMHNGGGDSIRAQ